MADFEYNGVDRNGKKVAGRLSVGTEGDLRMMLRSQGVRPTQIRKVGVLNTDLGSLFGKPGTTVKLEALVIFTRQLQVLVNAGVPLVQALDILMNQDGDKSLQIILGGIKDRVAAGSYFWEALSYYPKAFSRLYVSLIRAGESSGSVDQMLKRLARYLEDSQRIRRIVVGAAMYPLVALGIGLLITMFLLTVIVPKITSTVAQSGQKLPALTTNVLAVSNFLTENKLPITVASTAGVYLLVRYLQTSEGRALLDRFSFKVPVFGKIFQKAAIARFMRTLTTLLSSGVNLLDAIDICKTTVDNVVIEESVARIRVEIEAGKQLGAVMVRMPVFPKMVSQMVLVGESTGSLDKMLEKVADFYEEEVENQVGVLTKLIEPIMIVVLAGLVGVMLLAVYGPIIQSVGAIAG